MRQKEIYVEVAKSKQSVSAGTVAGALFGNKKSSRAIENSILNLNQRTYKRKKNIWLCSDCYPKIKGGEKSGLVEKLGGIILVIAVFILIFAWVGS